MELGLEFLTPEMQQKLQEKHDLNPPKKEEIIEDTVIVDDSIEPKKEESKEPSSKVESSSPYVPFAKHLVEEGLLSEEYLKDIEESGSLDALTDAMRKQFDNFTDRKINKYTPDIQELIALSESGVDRNKAKELIKDAMDLSKISNELLEDDTKMQESVIRKYLTRLNLTEEEQIEQIEYLKDTDKLLTKAMDVKAKLIDINIKEKELAKQQAVIAKKQEEKQIAEQLQVLRSELDKYAEIIPGIKISTVDREEIYKNLTTPVALDDNGNPITYVQEIRQKNPMKFEIMLNYLAKQGVFEGKFDTLIKGTRSKTVEELEKTLKDTNIFDKGIATVVKDQSKDQDKTKDLISFIPQSFDDLYKK